MRKTCSVSRSPSLKMTATSHASCVNVSSPVVSVSTKASGGVLLLMGCSSGGRPRIPRGRPSCGSDGVEQGGVHGGFRVVGAVPAAQAQERDGHDLTAEVPRLLGRLVPE